MRIAQVLGLLLAFIATQASANVVYNYVGNPFNEINNTSFSGDRITASLTLTDAVGLSFTGTIALVPQSSELVSLTLSSGTETVSVPEPFNAHAVIDFTNGQVTTWSIALLQNRSLVLATQNDVRNNQQDFVTISNNFGDFNRVTNAPGSWTRVNPVPVPAAIWFLGSALGGLGLMRRVVAA